MWLPPTELSENVRTLPVLELRELNGSRYTLTWPSISSERWDASHLRIKYGINDEETDT